MIVDSTYLTFDDYLETVMKNPDIKMYLKIQGIIEEYVDHRALAQHERIPQGNYYYVTRENYDEIYYLVAGQEFLEALTSGGAEAGKDWLHELLTNQGLVESLENYCFDQYVERVMKDPEIEMYLKLSGIITNYQAETAPSWKWLIGPAVDCDYRVTRRAGAVMTVTKMDLSQELIDLLDMSSGNQAGPAKWLHNNLQRAGLMP